MTWQSKSFWEKCFTFSAISEEKEKKYTILVKPRSNYSWVKEDIQINLFSTKLTSLLDLIAYTSKTR